MAIKKCNECNHDVSTKAESCPNCGAILKKKTGCLVYLLLIMFILLLFIGLREPSTNNKFRIENNKATFQDSATPFSQSVPTSHRPSSPKPTFTYRMKETVHVGYTSYTAWYSWWSNKLSDNTFLDEKPDAMFLFIELSVRNDDNKARTIPPFKLIDENGAEYQTTSKGFALKGSIGILDDLNPGVSKEGFIIFDVPKNHSYKLKVSGGFWSGEYAFIIIEPTHG